MKRASLFVTIFSFCIFFGMGMLYAQTLSPDINNNGTVDIQDLGILLSNWNQTGTNTADLNGSGAVDIQDLGILLSSWATSSAFEGGGHGVANIDTLPLANGQLPLSGSYGRDLDAGATYLDPNTQVPILKVTDMQTPITNTGMDKGYSEGGPIMSQPWKGDDGDVYYTCKVAGYLFDLNYTKRTIHNWRAVPSWGEIGFAFSLNPATPRIAYLVDSDTRTVQRYNTASDQVENIGNWPWVPSEQGLYLVWLQTQLNDAWIAGMFNDVGAVVAYNPISGQERSWSNIENIDEPHLDRERPYIYIAAAGRHLVGDLVRGDLSDPGTDLSFTLGAGHSAPVRGYIVGHTNWEAFGYYRYDPQSDEATIFAHVDDSIGFPGEYHQAGQWVFGNGVGAQQWILVDPSNGLGTRPSAKLKAGFMGYVRIDGAPARILAAHDSSGSSYTSQPQATISPDGKLVMWTSDMGGGNRVDTFIAFVPVENL